MIRSMTAFGRARETVGDREITVELKSVNNRFLDQNIRLPRVWSGLEDRVRSHVKDRVSRGKLDLFIGVAAGESSGTHIALDSAAAAQYLTALRQLRDEFGLKDDISVMTAARNNDLFTVQRDEIDEEADWLVLLPILDRALDAYDAAREAEGARLRADLLTKLDNLRKSAAFVAEQSPKTVAAYRERLENKLRQTLESLGAAADENRILTEVAIFADKVAVDEELVRLSSHLDAFTEALNASEPVGQRLNFLVQEIGREINTTGSKCTDAAVTAVVVEMKCELEKIREQIQNLE